MLYQISVALRVRGSGSLRRLLRDNGFKIYLKDVTDDKIISIDSDVDSADRAEIIREGRRFYIYCFYNSDESFPPQSVIGEIVDSLYVLDFKLRKYKDYQILP